MASATLSERLAARIRAEGAISFREFMEAALYDEESGYYSRGAPIGEGGDFVTSPSISPLFARAIARVFAADAAGLPGRLDFLEVGAGGGTFLADFRRALQELAPAVASRTRLLALERSESQRGKLRAIGAAEEVFGDLPEIPEASLSGWVFSNELYDALPVFRVEGGSREPVELAVGFSGNRFSWVRRRDESDLGSYLERFGIRLAIGQAAEVNLDAGPLHRSLCRLLSSGRIVAFDYGHRAPILYHPRARPAGTLAVHSHGRRGGDPLENPGSADLTAHVNWDDLIAAGESEGLRTEEIVRQSRFLLGAGLFEDARERKLEAFRLFDPEGLGEVVSVLIQSKGAIAVPLLSELTSRV
jgi:SAM-dependent MidA family methyltransferase